MLDYNPDLIADALDEFRAAEAVSPRAVGGGAAAVRATVQHRRRVKITTFSVLGALLIAVPIAAFAANPRGNNPPPTGESPTPTVSEVPSPSTSPTPAAGKGTFTAEELAAAKAPLPAGGFSECRGQITGTRRGNDVPMAYVQEVAHTNLDSDPALETAAWVICALFDKSDHIVIAYDADETGKPVVLGTVVKSVRPNGFSGIDAREGGGVIVTVSYDVLIGEPGQPDPQKREFAWDGTAFKQIAGPAAFPDRQRTDLSVTAAPLTLGPAANGKRSGTMTVTVKNLGPNASQNLMIQFALPATQVKVEGEPDAYARRPALKADETKTYQVRIEIPADNTHPTLNISIHSYVNDPVFDNNFVNVAINRA